MSVKTYSNTDHTQLSAHFNVQEFKCKCGNTHDILISSELIDKLKQLYTALNCSKIIVTSGYRCPTHDKNVGGTSTGQHTKGTAADICCYGQEGKPISSKLVCCKAQDIGFTGIANVDSSYQYTHVDVRNTGYRWREMKFTALERLRMIFIATTTSQKMPILRHPAAFWALMFLMHKAKLTGKKSKRLGK